jgi:predicted ATPase
MSAFDGVCVSNRAPDGLYENGLQRDLFLPFIARLKKETVVHDINSDTDYRRLAQHRRGLFYTRADFEDPDAEAELQFQALARACHKPVAPADVEVMMGRHLHVPAACPPPPHPLSETFLSGTMAISFFLRCVFCSFDTP